MKPLLLKIIIGTVVAFILLLVLVAMGQKAVALPLNNSRLETVAESKPDAIGENDWRDFAAEANYRTQLDFSLCSNKELMEGLNNDILLEGSTALPVVDSDELFELSPTNLSEAEFYNLCHLQ